MTSFVDQCVETVAGSAAAVVRGSKHRPRFKKLLKALAGTKNILITSHRYPDPDALGSGAALSDLLRQTLPPDVKISMSVTGEIGGGINEAFVRVADLKLTPWDDTTLADYDAIILLDVQPVVTYNPLPPGIMPTAVIDHHGLPGRKPHCPFRDIRTDVGATGSIIFSYFMEAEKNINATLAALLLYAIETDLAGAAGQPGELDNMALSSLTLLADTRKLYQMRYVDLPQNYYQCYYAGMASAMYYDDVLITHLDEIDSPEKPAVIADFLLRFDQVHWVMVTAVYENRLVVSLRTDSKLSAADIMRHVMRTSGEGGGHRTKAGGFIALQTPDPADIDKKRNKLRLKLLRALEIKSPGKKLVK